MLEELAAVDGLYRTDVIRVLIRREHAARFGAKGPPSERGAPRSNRPPRV